MKTKKKDFKPLCPFCESELENLVEVKGSWFSDKRIFCCPHCRKIVGINFKLA